MPFASRRCASVSRAWRIFDPTPNFRLVCSTAIRPTRAQRPDSPGGGSGRSTTRPVPMAWPPCIASTWYARASSASRSSASGTCCSSMNTTSRIASACARSPSFWTGVMVTSGGPSGWAMGGAHPNKNRRCAKGEDSAMGPVLIAGVVLLAIFLSLALFARGGPTETIGSGGLSPEAQGVARLGLEELGSVAGRLFNELGFTGASTEQLPGRFDLRMEDPTPVTGQKVYIRCLLLPEAGAVESAQVQAALDTARHEQLSKAVVLTVATFSDEAKLLAQGGGVELIDGNQLAALLRQHLPDVANRLGLPR